MNYEELNMEDKNFEKLIESINNVVKAIDKMKTEQLAKVNRPEVLYAIENINTGEIIFNSRGGTYQSKEAAYKKMCLMGQNNHRVVKYRLEK